jgi:hypothetical protein
MENLFSGIQEIYKDKMTTKRKKKKHEMVLSRVKQNDE